MIKKPNLIYRNATNFVFKICAWLYTGSHSMFAESIHSLADTINQLILAYGIHKSVQVSEKLNFLWNDKSHRNDASLSDRWLRSSVRVHQHEVCFIIDIWRWHLLSWNGIVILPRICGLSESSSHRRFFLGNSTVENQLFGTQFKQRLNFQAFCILGGSLISEGGTLVVAINAIRHAAKANNQTFKEYGQLCYSTFVLKSDLTVDHIDLQ